MDAPQNQFELIFEQFWTRTVPFPFSAQEKLKARAKSIFFELLGELFKTAGNPTAVRTIIAMNKIGRLLQAAHVIAVDNNPNPDDIAAAIERLLQSIEPKPVANEET